MRAKYKKRGPYIVLKSREVYKNPWIRVQEDKVIKSNGRRGIYSIVETKGGVTIVPIDIKGYCYLIKEYAYAVKRTEINLPGGGLDNNETPLKAAKRELLEETGLTSKKWKYLGKIFYFTNIFSTPEHLFLALDVKKKSRKLSSEIDKVISPPFKKVIKMALDNRIDSAERCTAIFRADRYLRTRKYEFTKAR